MLLFVRYTSGHRAGLCPGWHPYGEGSPLPEGLALALAVTARQQGAEVRLEIAPDAPAQLSLWGAP